MPPVASGLTNQAHRLPPAATVERKGWMGNTETTERKGGAAVLVQRVVSQPHRVQVSRRKGYRKPDNTVYVTRPGKWGNPYKVGKDGNAAECVEKFEAMMNTAMQLSRMREAVETLRGKNLGCYCPLNAPCHADVLLRLANDRTELRLPDSAATTTPKI